MVRQEELREAIARTLAELTGWDWYLLYKDKDTCVLSAFHEQADKIMSLLSEYCWLKDERELPEIGYPEGDAEWRIARQTQKNMSMAYWRPVIEITKDTKE